METSLLELVITHKLRLRETGLLGECAPQMLRCAQHDSQEFCHAERSEASRADLSVITSIRRRSRNFMNFIKSREQWDV